MGSISFSGSIHDDPFYEISSHLKVFPKPHFERIKKSFEKMLKGGGRENRLKGSLLLNVTWVQSYFFRARQTSFGNHY